MSCPSVYILQHNFTVGDINGNCQSLLMGAKRAQAKGADIVLAPELALSGYTPEDMMLDDDGIMHAVRRALQCLVEQAPLPMVVGLPWRENGCLYNAAALICDNRLQGMYKKNIIPNDSVFYEQRYFIAGDGEPLIFKLAGVSYAIQICADVWNVKQVERVANAKVDWTLCLNASPFSIGKHEQRLQMAADFTRNSGSGLFYCNLVGGQDDLIFDGASFMMNSQGDICGQFPMLQSHEGLICDMQAAIPQINEMIYTALKMGIHDYVTKTGFTGGVVLGLSGGIDSALVAALAVDALGKDKVLAVMMPSPYTSNASLEDAAQIALRLGIEYLTIPIDELMKTMNGVLQSHILPRDNDMTWENIQARLRGQLLMALSNNRDLLLLATGNKSELACGYATLYGDMCGGFAPLKDVVKTKVWELAQYRNNLGEVIPQRVIERAPSAELRDNQTDQQTLPPYEEIDALIESHVEQQPRGQLSQTVNQATTSHFLSLLINSEYKRHQGAIGPRVTARSFGRDWRMPIANRYRYD